MAVASVVTGNTRFTSNFTETITTGLTNPQTPTGIITQNPTYVNGASAAINTVDVIYAKQLTLSTSTTINLLSGLTDLGGAAAVFGRVRELVIQVVDVTAGHYVNVFSAASNGWVVGLPLVASQLLIPPGGMLHLADPLSFGGTTGIYVPAGAGTFTISAAVGGTVVNVLIAGCSVT